MTDARDTKREARAHTDASLGAERAVTDAELQQRSQRSQRVLDDLIERDRMIADARLLRFRDRADRILSEDRSPPSSTGRTVRMERLVDQETRMERAVVDELLEDERQRADQAAVDERRERDAHQARQGESREATDEQLRNERTEADAAGVGSGRTKGALAERKSEHAGRGDVLSAVAHELRSPLSVVVLNAELLAEEIDDTVLRDAAHDIVRASARMERLLCDLLDVTRIQGGVFRIAREEHDVGALLAEVQRTYEPLFAARELTFTVELPPAHTVASFDHDRIVQVLSNLLGNAMKFTPPHGAVSLRVETHEGLPVEIVLQNSGPGIAASALPHVFERFWQLDGDLTRGLGLGLFICRKIVEGHGGHIRVESGLGQGATFRFTLPDA